MALHQLTSVTMGVPNVSQTTDYYAEFGLQPAADGWPAGHRDPGRHGRRHDTGDHAAPVTLADGAAAWPRRELAAS